MTIEPMSKLTIGFSTPHKFHVFPTLIKWWDKFLAGGIPTIGASHSYTRFVSMTWGRDFVYEAKGTKTHFTSGRLFEEINKVLEEYEVLVPHETAVKIGRLCVDREGTPYAIKQTFGKILTNLVYLLTWRKVWIKNPWADGKTSVDCLEEMGYMIADGLEIKVDLDLEGISIQEFRDWFRSLPGVVQTKGADVRIMETETKTI